LQKGTVSRSILSDELSSSLNALQVELEESSLYEQIESRRAVLKKAIPKTLIDKVGVDELMRRLPEQVGRLDKLLVSCPVFIDAPN
jgi:glutamate dehydrogenase